MSCSFADRGEVNNAIDFCDLYVDTKWIIWDWNFRLCHVICVGIFRDRKFGANLWVQWLKRRKKCWTSQTVHWCEENLCIFVAFAITGGFPFASAFFFYEQRYFSFSNSFFCIFVANFLFSNSFHRSIALRFSESAKAALNEGFIFFTSSNLSACYIFLLLLKKKKTVSKTFCAPKWAISVLITTKGITWDNA